MIRYYIPKDDRLMLMVAMPQRGRDRGLLKSRCRKCLLIKTRWLQEIVGKMWWAFGIGGNR